LDIFLLSTEMYRTEPCKYYKIGRLGVDIYVDGVTAFLGCESNAEDMLGSWGQDVAKEYLHHILNQKK
jgi:hypothetical protein